jgi:pimeloyl-ACP methyl ester carboxylesterase
VAEIVDVPGATLWTESQGAGVPLVLCHGGPGLSDNLAPMAAMVDDVARAVADLAPRGRYVEIPDAAHSPWLERPEPLRAFLAELR